MRRLRSWARVAFVGAFLGASVLAPSAGTAAAPAQVPEPGVRVIPDTGIRPGTEVQVEITGFSSQQVIGLLQCDVSVLGDPTSIVGNPRCLFLRFILPVPSQDPFTVPVTIQEAFATGSRDGTPITHCGDAPDDCIVAAFGVPDSLVRTAPISVEPGPLAVAPSDQLPGDPVHVFVTGAPNAHVTVAQCLGAVGTPDPATQCASVTPLRLDGTGRADTALTVVQSVGGQDCTIGGCVVTLFDATGASVTARGLTVYPRLPLTLSVDDHLELGDGFPLRVHIENPRNRTLLVAQCARTVAAGQVSTGPCATPVELVVDRSTLAIEPDVVVHRDFVGADGSEVHCGATADACVIAVQSDDGQFLTHPIAFSVPDVVTLAPATGLLEGQPITVTASGLRPDTTYRILRCHGLTGEVFGEPETCDDPVADSPWIVSTPQGTLTTTVPALQRYTSIAGENVYCRAQCQIAITRDDLFTPLVSANAAYAMAVGSLSASPNAGLVNGQQVTVTGTQLMPTYDGPRVGEIPTGRWALLQCSRALEQDLTVAGVRASCVVPSGGGVVAVAHSDLTRQVKVHARLRPDTGPAVDCRAAVDACQIVLIRQEQDSTISFHAAPISFR